MIRRTIGLSIAIVLATPVAAESVKGAQTAANGVVLETYIDEFAGRAEYASPEVKFKLPDQYMDSMAFVSRVKKGGVWGPTELVVLAYYRGDWRFYNSAVFRGGEAAGFREGSRDVLSCSGSRYGGCSHSESMHITVTPDQLAKYSENGQIPIQIGARSAGGSVVTIPVAYFEAMNALK